MQLVAYGAQDIYLTGNAHITFFKSVYRRHTNFAIEAIEQVFNGNADFGRRVTALISRNGDLINRMYVEVTLPRLEIQGASARWVDDIGHHLLHQMEVEVGGQMIDRQHGDWLQLWMLLTLPLDKQAGYNKMIGQDGQTHPNGEDFETSLQAFNQEAKERRQLFIPLQFWFCRHAGLSLPLIALQYHEVKIVLQFRGLEDLIDTDNEEVTRDLSLVDAKLWVDYIYLDTDERRRMAQVSHEYLIEQVQHNGDQAVNGSTARVKMTYNHPVKELVWFVRHDDIATEKQWSNYTDTLADEEDPVDANHRNPNNSKNPVRTAKILLNGHDRFSARTGEYFNLVQPYQHHTRIPESPGVNVYSFGLHPEAHQPSGTVNMSRIDTAELVLDVAYNEESFTNIQAKLFIFAHNYNVFRVMSGNLPLPQNNTRVVRH